MKTHGTATLLNVSDVQASLNFYEALGFAVGEEVSDGNELAWCSLSLNGICLMLNQSSRAESESRRKRPDYSDFVLYLYVDDAAACFPQFAEQGLNCRHVGPQDYGLDEVWLRDPDGYHVVVASDV